MADKHPYVNSVGPLVQLINHIRKSTPDTLNAAILKKLGLAPGNEGRLINTAQYLGIVDDQGKITDQASKVFSLHSDSDFQGQFGKMVRDAYAELFNLYKDGTWEANKDQLITFFRQSDQSTAIVGEKQANTFKAIAAIAGHGSIRGAKVRDKIANKKLGFKSKNNPIGSEPRVAAKAVLANSERTRDVGLTVRIEVNLPSQGDQETYDRIFKSIKENLLNE